MRLLIVFITIAICGPWAAVAQSTAVPTPDELPLPSLVILPGDTDERVAMVRNIQTHLNRLGCNAGEATGYWSAQGDAALARLAEIRPDTKGVRLSISLQSFLELMPPAICPSSQSCVDWGDSEICESGDANILTVALQSELNRMGCDAGPADGSWGRRSDAALARAAEKSPNLKDAQPDLALLSILVGLDATHCPLVCLASEVLTGGKCVRKTCPSAQRLNGDGTCSAPKNCYNYNGRTYCE